MDDFDRVRQKIRDLQSRFLGAHGAGTDFSPESTPPQDFWKRQYEEEKRKLEEQLQLKENALSRRIQEMESRQPQQQQRPTPPHTIDQPAFQEIEKENEQLKRKMEMLQSENADLKSQINKVFQLHNQDLESVAEITKQLGLEKIRRQEDGKALQQGMDNLRLESEKKIQQVEKEKSDLVKLIEEIKSNNTSFVAAHKVLKEENIILKENLIHHNETAAMRQRLHFVSGEKMAEGLARRLKNYLSLILGAADLCLRSPDAALSRNYFAELMEVEAQAEQVLSEFLQISKYPDPRLEEMPVNDLIESVLKGLDDQAQKAQVSFGKEWGQIPPIPADRILLKEALHHIVLNAVEASPAGGTVQLKSFHNPASQKIEIQIADSGPGMPDAVLSKLFQPYFTTKKGHKGLGICLAKKNINLHRGWITVSSTEGSGTTVTLEIPAAKLK